MPPSLPSPDAASRAARDALAANLRLRRKAKHLTVTALAERAGVSRQAVHLILGSGDARLDTLARLAWTLDAEPADLLRPPDAPTAPLP